MNQSKHFVFMTTVARKADARKLAKMAVEKRLAACVQIVPGVISFYRWKGKLERSAEFLLLFKTAKKALPELMKVLKASHPYSLPELVAVTVSAGSRDYLNWVDSEVQLKKKRKKI